MKKKILVLALTAVFLSLTALGSAAYFTAEGRATNVITTGKVDMALNEMQQVPGTDGELVEEDYPEDTITGVMPGRKISKIPYVVGLEDTQPFYTRVWVEITIALADGTQPETNEYITLNYDKENWVKGEDGWWYYQGIIGDGDRKALFTEVAFDPTMPNDYQNCTVEIDVSAQATQVKNNPVPKDAQGNADYTAIQGWPAVPAQ